MELRDKIALVTGAGIRLGRALAVALGGERMRVVVHYNSSQEGARETARLIEESGGKATLIGADLTRTDAPEALIRDVARELGGLDVLINSSAIMQRTPLGSVTAQQWDAMMAINLRTPFLLAQAAAPSMARSSRSGSPDRPTSHTTNPRPTRRPRCT